MRIQTKLLAWAATFCAVLVLSPIHQVKATASATLALTSSGDGDNVRLNVTGEPSKSVLFYFTRSGEGPQLYSLGKTNSSGIFSATISSASYGIVSNSVVYVIVDGQRSADVAWPYMTAGGAFSLSETSVAMKPRESKTITAYNSGGLLYLSNNSNPPVANVNIDGTQITIKSNIYGSSVVSVCSQTSTTTACASIYINVQDNATQPLAFSQSNVSVAAGQTVSVAIYGTSTVYMVTNNSNYSAIQASTSGSNVNLTATAGASGSAAITVCSSNMLSCGIINASIGSSNSSNITFNPSSASMSIGQSITVSIWGATSSTFSIFNNTNPTAIQAAVSDRNLLLTAKTDGSSKITVCSSLGSCGVFEVTVVSSTQGGLLTISQNNLWLSIGQSSSLKVSGGSMPYSILENSKTIIKTVIDGSILTVSGLSAGVGTVDVCSAGGGCTSLSVLVNGSATVTPLSLGQRNVYLEAGKQATVAIFGDGGYYVSGNSAPAVASMSISGRDALITAISAGNTNITICQNGGQCATLYVSVSGSSSSVTTQTNTNSSTTTATIAVDSTNNTNTTTNNQPNTPSSNSTGISSTARIALEASLVSSGASDGLLNDLGAVRNGVKESDTQKKYTEKITMLVSANLGESAIKAINNFITYGTQGTQILGEGERAGVINSYQQAYSKLPTDNNAWSDAIKIGLGRWPSERSEKAEAQAKLEFKKVYHREADLKNNKDENAIMVIAYGLRPVKRNTASEAAAIKIFKSVYRHAPVNSLAWNIVRAIAYSGTKR